MKLRGIFVAAALAALLQFAGCGGSSDSTPSAPAVADKDADGFSEAAGDCNDQSAAVNPNGTIAAQSCLWTTTDWNCPRGSEKAPENADAIFVRVVNNSCSTLLIADATVHVTVLEANGTFNLPGEKWTSEHVPFSPNSLPMAVSADVEVDGDIVCTNRTGGGTYNVVRAEVTLQTSAGVVRCVTGNSHTTRFPFGGAATLGARDLQDGQRGALQIR